MGVFKFVIIVCLLARIWGGENPMGASAGRTTVDVISPEKEDASPRNPVMVIALKKNSLDMDLAGGSDRKGKNMTETRAQLVPRRNRRDREFTGNIYADCFLLTLISFVFIMCAAAFALELIRMLINGPTSMAPVSLYYDGWIPIYGGPRRAPGESA